MKQILKPLQGSPGQRNFILSARKVIESEMIFRKEGITMSGSPGYNEFARKVADPDKIKNIIKILKRSVTIDSW